MLNKTKQEADESQPKEKEKDEHCNGNILCL